VFGDLSLCRGCACRLLLLLQQRSRRCALFSLLQCLAAPIRRGTCLPDLLPPRRIPCVRPLCRWKRGLSNAPSIAQPPRRLLATEALVFASKGVC